MLLQKYGCLPQIGDLLMRPLMYPLSGTFKEAPQETHWWNNVRLRNEQISYLSRDWMVHHPGDPSAVERWFLRIIPRFHMPLCGGWRQYIVLEPVLYDKIWYVGWIPPDGPAGLSLLPVTTGKIRVTVGPNVCAWFGITSHESQIHLSNTGSGIIGKCPREDASIPLR